MHDGKYPIEGLPPPYGRCVGFVLKARERDTKSKAKVRKGLKARAAKKKEFHKVRVAQKADLTHVVRMGHWAVMGLKPGIIFGTEGCGPCVGLIVLKTNRSAFCAHIDHHLSMATQEDSEKKAAHRKSLRLSLQLSLPPPHHVLKFGVASLKSSSISKLTIDLIKEIYKGKLSKGGDIKGENIYITGKGEIKSGHQAEVNAGGAIKVKSGEIHVIETRKEGLTVTDDNEETYLKYAIV